GVPGLRWLEEGGIPAIEPYARGVAALHSPETAIADFAGVARALAELVEAAGGRVRTGAAVARVLPGSSAVAIELADGSRLHGDLNARDTFDAFTWPGTWRMMRRHWRAGAGELARSLRKRLFINEIQRYVPAVRVEDAVRAPAGVRAQAVDRDGSLVDDFRLG